EEAEKFAAALERAGEVHKNYQTDVIIYEDQGDTVTGQEKELTKILEGDVQMNKPLKFGPTFFQYTLYQSGYQQNEFKEMSFGLFHESGDELGEVTIDLY